METTAEGVEAQDEIELIRDLGCSHIQGFVYGMPISDGLVLAKLGSNTAVVATGVSVTRAPRVRMLRSVIIEVDGIKHGARLRDVSFSGAMLDKLTTDAIPVGCNLTIELSEGQFVPAIVRWTNFDRVGLELLTAFDFRKLSPPVQRTFGRAGS